MVGPLYMNPVYNTWGMYALGLLMEGAMFGCLVILLLVYKQLVPLETIIARKKNSEEEKKEKA